MVKIKKVRFPCGLCLKNFITIKNVSTGENKEIKYKHAEPLINKGEWVISEATTTP